MKKEKCKTCKFAEIDLDSYEPPVCNSNPQYVIRDEGNYVVECSNYQSVNPIKRFIIKSFINFMEKSNE